VVEPRSTTRGAGYSGPLFYARRSPRSAAVAVAVGALAVSTTAIFIDLSGASSATSSVWRCLLAAPLVALAARWEPRAARTAPPPRQRVALAALCGALFAGDMIFWAQSIGEIGAGLSTVLVNAQVIIVPGLAWAIDRERPPLRYFVALPLMCFGVAMAGGLADGAGAGSRAAIGTLHALLAAGAYSGFLFLLRRLGDATAVRSYRDTLAVAALVSLVAGAFTGGLTVHPGWTAFGWLVLVAAVGQAPGWALVAVGSPRLSTSHAAALLLLTPVGALVMSIVLLDQVPTELQVLGCALVVAGVVVQSLRWRRRPPQRPRKQTSTPLLSRGRWPRG
jgi:drug/metabolite transporter (DMT)-like permease